MADSDFGQNVLGSDYLPASPLYPVQNLTAPIASAPPPGQGAAPARDMSPGVSAPAAASGLPPWVAGLLPSPPGGMFGPNTGRVMSALGAGLSSAGQNWNKPALAAFASGAGAALQGGQQFDNQVQDAKLKALHAAIAAFKVGDLAAYHRSLADYHKTLADEKRQHTRPATPPPAPPESQLPPVPAVDPVGAAASVAPPAQGGGASAEAAAVQPQVTVAHLRALDRLLTDAGVPPDRVQAADLDSAARLMAAKAMPADEALETASLRNAIDAGHVSPAEVNLIYGPGAADAIRSTATS
jgi:hypothetical protein